MELHASDKTSSGTSAAEQPQLQVSGTIVNNLGSDASLSLNVLETKTGLSQGSWQQMPPVLISPSGSGSFTVAGSLGGAVGHAVYDVLVNGSQQGTAILSFNVPGQSPDSDGAGVSVPPPFVGEAKILVNVPPVFNLAFVVGYEP
jgi:hypothetical protein